MRKSTIDKLCEAINQASGITYPNQGYLYFADIKGNGQSRRSVWLVCNDSGGVMRSSLNGATYRQTAENLRRDLQHFQFKGA